MGFGRMSNPGVRVTSGGRIWVPLGAWNDLATSGALVRPGASAPLNTTIRAGGFIRSQQWAVGDDASKSDHIGHDWMVGTAASNHIHWLLPTAPVGARRFQFRLYWMLIQDDEIATAETTDDQEIVITGKGQYYSNKLEFTDINLAVKPAGWTNFPRESCSIALAIQRIACTVPAEEYPDRVEVINWDTHLLVDSLGTATEWPPYTK